MNQTESTKETILAPTPGFELQTMIYADYSLLHSLSAVPASLQHFHTRQVPLKINSYCSLML